MHFSKSSQPIQALASMCMLRDSPCVLSLTREQNQMAGKLVRKL